MGIYGRLKKVQIAAAELQYEIAAILEDIERHQRGEKSVVPVRFKIEEFDCPDEFEALCKAHIKGERGVASQNKYIEAIEWCVSRKGLSRAEAAGYIRERAEMYSKLQKFPKGMTDWLELKIFEQTNEAWEGRKGIDDLYGKDSA